MVIDPLDTLKPLKRVLDFSNLDAEELFLTEIVTKYLDSMLMQDAMAMGSKISSMSYDEKTTALRAQQVGKGYRHLNSDQVSRIRNSNLGKTASTLGYTLSNEILTPSQN